MTKNKESTRAAELLRAEKETQLLAEELIGIARTGRVSDIHFDEIPDQVRVRWRRDGRMEDIAIMTVEKGKSLARYFKVGAGLPPVTAEMPGEGFLEVPVGEEDELVSVRVSSIRGSSGTKTSLRILDAFRSATDLSDLGIDREAADWITDWAENGSGMLLVCGPTGSGKTTTLYTLLESLSSKSLNLVSIEDPVERNVEAVTQVDLSLERELDEQTGMRALLRHDPDVIFVGELRDGGIASAAVQAAFSGHVIISTMHSHDPVGAVERLRGFDLPNHEIASSLKGVLGQRLVRKSADEEDWLTDAESAWLSERGIEQFSERKVYSDRSHEYEGRSGVFEWWRTGEDGYYDILEGKDERTIRKGLEDRGHETLISAGVSRVAEGETTVEEIRQLE